MSPDRLPPPAEDRVLRASLDFAAVAAEAGPLSPEYHRAFAAFGRALRARLLLETCRGLPTDVVSHLIVVAVRMALDGPAHRAVAPRIVRTAELTLEQATRLLAADESDGVR